MHIAYDSEGCAGTHLALIVSLRFRSQIILGPAVTSYDLEPCDSRMHNFVCRPIVAIGFPLLVLMLLIIPVEVASSDEPKNSDTESSKTEALESDTKADEASTSDGSTPLSLPQMIWEYKLTLGEDVDIRIGDIILLCVSIACGITLAYYLSRWIAKLIFPWLGIRDGVAIAWRLIIRNVLALFLIFVSFQFFGVPLTAFAVVGGAAALAIGFGSKDIANNFMSGLIILTEQPVRVNDIVLFDSQQCIVTYIGLRSTRLRNLENYELIVPNSTLIERMVTNLTLSDNRIRIVLPLEVDRTEDVKRSMARMSDALRQVQGVNLDSAPWVLLKSVDTYYLNFDIHVTIEFEDLTEIPLVKSRVLSVLADLFPTESNEQPEPSTSTLDDPTNGDETVNRTLPKKDPKAIQSEIAALQKLLRQCN
jgi:small-conductance mechanosensitive channel